MKPVAFLHIYIFVLESATSKVIRSVKWTIIAIEVVTLKLFIYYNLLL